MAKGEKISANLRCSRTSHGKRLSETKSSNFVGKRETWRHAVIGRPFKWKLVVLVNAKNQDTQVSSLSEERRPSLRSSYRHPDKYPRPWGWSCWTTLWCQNLGSFVWSTTNTKQYSQKPPNQSDQILPRPLALVSSLSQMHQSGIRRGPKALTHA